MPTMKAAERDRRNAQVLQLFLGGASHRTIARAVGLRSHRSVGNIVQAALGSTTDRRELLTDEAFAVWQERSERLLRAHWGPALEGNHRSAELCRKILAQHVLVYGLAQEVAWPVRGPMRWSLSLIPATTRGWMCWSACAATVPAPSWHALPANHGCVQRVSGKA
jgi:hypothetical protein